MTHILIVVEVPTDKLDMVRKFFIEHELYPVEIEWLPTHESEVQETKAMEMLKNGTV